MPFPDAHPSLLRALAEREYLEPTLVQAAVLVPEAAGRDLLVSAQTGSGKTVAYGLALAPTLLGDAEKFEPRTKPLALVVAPTRELALQVQRELTWLYAKAGAKIASCVGGMDIRREADTLARGAHIVVGTPGRLCDHLERKRLDLSGLQALVLDEADEMLDLGFKDDLERILGQAPAERRTLLFSATIPKPIASLAKQYQKDAMRIATSADKEPHGDIEYRAIQIAPRDREHAVVNVLRYLDVKGALVFCQTREGVKHLHGSLLERGFSVVALSGELSQSERTHALQALRDGRARACVATDVAARGLDLPDLGLVIHADLPRDRQTLLHRSGRTGRAGRKGLCVLLVPHAARRQMESVLYAANIDAMWSAPPTPEQILAKDQERLVREISLLAQDPSEDDLAAARALLAEQSAELVAAALVRLQRSRLPAPEEILVSDVTPRTTNRPPPRPRTDHTDAVWFRLNVGRTNNADPRWLIPLICRRGDVTKDDIGKINILPRETHFEISRAAAERFSVAMRRPDAKDKNVRIDALPADHVAPSAPPGRGRPMPRKLPGGPRRV